MPEIKSALLCYKPNSNSLCILGL